MIAKAQRDASSRVGAGGETSQHKQAHGECRLRVQFGLHLARPLAHAPGAAFLACPAQALHKVP